MLGLFQTSLNAYQIDRTITGSAAWHVDIWNLQSVYIAVILFCACAMSESGSLTTVTLYICCSCESRHTPSFFSSRANAHMHMAKSTRCKASSVKKVNIVARPCDVIAGGWRVEWDRARCLSITGSLWVNDVWLIYIWNIPYYTRHTPYIYQV